MVTISPEPQTDNTYSLASYKWSNGGQLGGNPNLTKYCQQSEYGYNGFTDTLTELEICDDAATVNWGSEWQMPSDDQLGELYDSNNTYTIWTKVNGVYGRKITSKKEGYNDRYIFLPAAGCRYDGSLYDVGSWGNCWSRSLNASDSNIAHGVYFDSLGINKSYYNRDYGFSVRPVRVAKN